jgi:hypothetical protein
MSEVAVGSKDTIESFVRGWKRRHLAIWSLTTAAPMAVVAWMGNGIVVKVLIAALLAGSLVGLTFDYRRAGSAAHGPKREALRLHQREMGLLRVARWVPFLAALAVVVKAKMRPLTAAESLVALALVLAGLAVPFGFIPAARRAGDKLRETAE